MFRASRAYAFIAFKRMYSTSFNDPNVFKTSAYINGVWVDKPGSFDVTNPSTSEGIAQVTNCQIGDYQEAIESAKTAFDQYRYSSAQEKSRILYNIHTLIQENKDDLARIITLENGKPFEDARNEVLYSASYFKWFAEETPRIYGTVIQSSSSFDKQIMAIRQPLGVVAILTPWNFPSAMIARKLAPVIATGNTCVIKPASETPLSALALGHLCEKAGLPPGVCNILPTKESSQVGEYICRHKLVRKITFTGSTATGKILMNQSSHPDTTIKRVSMELGGNAPFIIFSDADVDRALDGIIACKFRQSGQTCICANRIFIQQDLYEEFASGLVQRIKDTFKLGDGLAKGTTHGPLINERAVARVSSLVEDAKNKGASVLIGGNVAKSIGPLFFEPTVLKGVDESMDIFHTEIFGPVASLIKFEHVEEVVAMANNTDVGLAGYFYTQNIPLAIKVANRLEVGMVGINNSAISDAAMPFGGIKDSGMGREGSKYGIEDYTELKSIVLQG